MRLEYVPARYEAFRTESPDLSLCRVASREKGLYRLLGADGTCQARVSGKFQYGAKSASDYPAVGDYVMADLNDDTAVIRRVLPRTSVFLRKAAGVDIVTTSIIEEGGAQIAPYLVKGKTLAFVGSSGVGKSTLINALLGEDRLKTNGLRNDGKGRHTTTWRELFILSCGATVIDTPGMRELGVWDADEGLSAGFADIEALTGKCRFRDCAHRTEPDCAVRAVLEGGELSADCLLSYEKLRTENACSENAESYLAAKEEKFKKIAMLNKANRKK